MLLNAQHPDGHDTAFPVTESANGMSRDSELQYRRDGFYDEIVVDCANSRRQLGCQMDRLFLCPRADGPP
jgi:hypothetical protein